MKRSDLARNFAAIATNADWSEKTVAAAFARRLPNALQSDGATLAAEITRTLKSPYAPGTKTVAREIAVQDAFERIWQFCRRRNLWPALDLTTPSMSPIAAFAALDVPDLPTVDALCEWLLIAPERLDHLADPQNRHEAHGDMAVNNYHYHLQAKRSGQCRLIEAPKAALKSLQRRILRDILDAVPANDAAFGFVRGRNCIQAASRHAGEAMVICFDLKHFFPSVATPRVFGLFRCLGYPHAVSSMLTALTTNATPSRILRNLSSEDRTLFLRPHLPQGAPTSPTLANLACHSLDRRLVGLADRIGAQYSRYADDLAFSGDRSIKRTLLDLVPEIIAHEGFNLQDAKTRTMPATGRQTVTGIVVNQHVNVSRRHFDHLKAVIHRSGKPEDNRLLDPRFRASILGQIGWIEALNPARGEKLRRLLEAAWARRFESDASR